MNGHGNSNIMSGCCGYSMAMSTRQQNMQPAQMQPAQMQPAQMPPPVQRQAVLDTSDPVTSGTPPVSITPTTLQSTDFLAGLLTTYIGQTVRVQFLIGTTGPLLDLTGVLQQVGANYITLLLAETDDLVVCDLFSIKFVTIYR